MKMLPLFLGLGSMILLAGCATTPCGYQPNCSQTYIMQSSTCNPCKPVCRERTCTSCPYKVSSCNSCYGSMSYQTCYGCPPTCQTSYGWI